VSAPQHRYGGRPIEAMSGHNLLPLVNGAADRVRAEEEAVGYELAGNAALFQGDYKIVINRGPVGDNQWRLFNIVTDPGETEDLSSALPARLQRMLGLYQQYVNEVGVLPVPAGYDDTRQVALNGLHDRFGSQILLLLLSFIVLLPFYLVYRLKNRD
jgi:arylsulfatase A-like enzyme